MCRHFFLVFSCFVPTPERMATIYKKPNSSFFFAQYFNADGKRVSKSTGVTGKREAKRIADQFEAEERDKRNKAGQLPKMFSSIIEAAAREAAQGELTLARAEELVNRLHKLANPDHVEVSLREYWSQWIDDQRPHVTESTTENYEDDLARFAEGAGDKVMDSPIRSLTTDKVKSAMDKLRKIGGRKNSTINLTLSTLRRVMESAVARKLATSNPAKQCRQLPQSDSNERAPFTLPEIRSMIDHPATSDEWKGAITIAAQTGLRLGDVLNLNRANVKNGRFVVMPQKTARTKKVISVPITPACFRWIAEKKGDFFPTLKDQSTPKTSMQFGAIMKKAGVTKEIELPGGIKAVRSFHSLRHTFASMLAEADVHADVRQKLTGHSSSKIHQRYTHHDEALDRAVGMLPDL